MIENNTDVKDNQIEKGAINIWRTPALVLGWYALLVGMLTIYLYEHGLNRMVDSWFEREEYSHGIMIPVLSIFLIWQKKDILETCEFKGGYSGIVVVLLGILLIFLGEVSAITIFIQYGYVFAVAGLALSYMGWPAFKHVIIPFILLLFMIPLPAVIFQELSQYLQNISTQIGVFVIQLFDISVYVEGNVIDLGVYKLQVVEACNGLRYLFPLMTLGFIAAYFYKVETWKRVVIFLSSMPITVLMNSFRIGVIGVTVEYWGIEMAEGFLHDFEGWIIFMACTGLLILEMWLFARFSKVKQPLLEVFGLELPADSPPGAAVNARPLPKQMVVASVLVVITIVAGYFTPERVDVAIDRVQLSDFPDMLGEWDSSRRPKESLDGEIIAALQFDDYLLKSYTNNVGEVINLYIAYYGSQSKGASIHSPRACLPSGGWSINSFADYAVGDVLNNSGKPFEVNRVLIQMGDMSQLVYYWFPQRGRNVTNEYALKWYIFLDSLMMGRSDGALVRITTLVRQGEDLKNADARLTSFFKEINAIMPQYIPE